MGGERRYDGDVFYLKIDSGTKADVRKLVEDNLSKFHPMSHRQGGGILLYGNVDPLGADDYNRLFPMRQFH